MANVSDIDALVPKPFIHKVAGEEIRQQALPIRKLISVIQFVEQNKDLLDGFKMLGKPSEEGGVVVTFSAVLENGVYTRVYSLLRLLLPDAKKSDGSALLTDEWCGDHLSNAHIVAIVKTALIQNELYELFTKAKDLLGPAFAAIFRQNMTAKMPAPPASV